MASQLLLEDSGLAYEAIKVNTRDPEAKAEYVKKVNPKGQVPALVVDGEIITEAPAIITAISQLALKKHYTGKTPLDNVRFYEWMNYLSGTFHGKSFTPIFKPSAYTDDASAEASIKAKAQANVLASFKNVEEKLATLGGPKHALGDSLTGVDAYLVTFILWAKQFQMDLSPFPNYMKLFEGISQTSAFESMREQQV